MGTMSEAMLPFGLRAPRVGVTGACGYLSVSQGVVAD
jgi:hypothetical protein